MQFLYDQSWNKRGMSLLWSPEALHPVAKPDEVLSFREFVSLSRHWPKALPSQNGRTLVVAGLDGCLDMLSPEEGEIWLEEDVSPLLMSFRDEYELEGALVFWLPNGRRRIHATQESYWWACGQPHQDAKIPLGQFLWGGAEGEVKRILIPGTPEAEYDGKGWQGLHLARLS